MVRRLQAPLQSLVAARAGVGGLLAGAARAARRLLRHARHVQPQRRRAAGAAAAPRSAPAQVKVGLILPLSAGGNAGVAAQSMKNAAEMALAEFNSPNIQLLVKDDAGTSGGAQQAAQQALDEGAEIIIGPLFAHSVGAVGAARAPARRAGDRVLDRRQRRGARRLSAELPAGVRRRPHRRLRGRQRQALVRRACCRTSAYGTVVEADVQAGGGAQGRRASSRSSAIALDAGAHGSAGAARRAGGAQRRRDLHSRRRRRRCRRWCRR